MGDMTDNDSKGCKTRWVKSHCDIVYFKKEGRGGNNGYVTPK
jgi:hypothetical protein